MDKTEVVAALNHVREAGKQFNNSRFAFEADRTAVMRRLVMEGAINYMSADEIGAASGLGERTVKTMMRGEGLDPRQRKPQLAKHSARVLADNAALLGLEPREMDLMSPLAYLPAGSLLRQQVDAERLAPVTEIEPERVAEGNWCRRCEIFETGFDGYYETDQGQMECAACGCPDHSHTSVNVVNG